jgi:hypothetical protein
MSLDAMRQAIGETLTQANRGATLDEVSMDVLSKLYDQGFEVKPRDLGLPDSGLTPMKQGIIELHEIFETMQDQGFTRDEAMGLLTVVLSGQLHRWTGGQS